MNETPTTPHDQPLAPPPEYQLGRAIAQAIAQHTNLTTDTITAVYADSTHITIRYTIQLTPEAFDHRVLILDARTGARKPLMATGDIPSEQNRILNEGAIDG